MKSILKVLVGSQAHGLAGPDSDYDYRGVYVRPTSEILALGAKPHTTQWSEADKTAGEKLDDTSWEIGHFLSLAVHCNPTILEVFCAPRADNGPEWSSYGTDLRDLFKCVWHPQAVQDAFIGYGLNQRKKFLDNKDQRAPKYAVAYLRVLYQAWALLNFRVLTVDMTETPVFDTLKKWRTGEYTLGEVVDTTAFWTERVKEGRARCKQTANLGPVNAFLLHVRRKLW